MSHYVWAHLLCFPSAFCAWSRLIGIFWTTRGKFNPVLIPGFKVIQVLWPWIPQHPWRSAFSLSHLTAGKTREHCFIEDFLKKHWCRSHPCINSAKKVRTLKNEGARQLRDHALPWQPHPLLCSSGISGAFFHAWLNLLWLHLKYSFLLKSSKALALANVTRSHLYNTGLALFQN